MSSLLKAALTPGKPGKDKRASEKKKKEEKDKKDEKKGKQRSGSSGNGQAPLAAAPEAPAPGPRHSQDSHGQSDAPAIQVSDSEKRTPAQLISIPKYSGEIPPPFPPEFSWRYEQYPADVRKAIEDKKSALDKTLVEKYPHHLFTVVRFLLREYFKDVPAPPVTTKEFIKAKKSRPYALVSQIEQAKQTILTPPKPMKKLFKGNEKAGEGGFGAVTVAKDLNSKSGKERVAIKRVPHDSSRTRENNWTEIAFLSAAKHANIVQFKNAYLVKDDKEEIWIVMEYLEGGTLGEAAAANALSEDHIAFVAHEILMALSFLHGCQWVHRDLKSANVMLSIKGEIKLIDFGLCADFSEGPRIQMLGSPYWIPPEMIWSHPHSYPADVWSMAVCLLELLLTHPPHSESNIKGMFYVATKGLTDQIPATVSPGCRAFLTRCLILDPELRPTVAELLKDPWVIRPNLNKGIDEVLRQVFLSASFQNLGF